MGQRSRFHRACCTILTGSCVLPLALVLMHCAVAVSGAVMAIDFGSEFIKVSVVKPGRTPISIVHNEMSKRKTSAMVAFVEGERLLGEEAAALTGRYPERVYARTRDLLGKPADHTSVSGLLQAQYLPYKVVPHAERGTVVVQTHTGEQLSAEELVASIAHYAKLITQAGSEGSPIVDCVFAVPAWFGMNQRQALLDAAELAGLNVLSLVNTHAAAALQFGIERNFTGKTEHVLFYDLGAGSVEVALVRYSSFTIKEGFRNNTYGQFEVLDAAWDNEVGAEQLNIILMEHFADEFNKGLAAGEDIRKHPRAMAKLKKQVKRTKEILSANSEASVSVEELHGGRDFRSRITREDFEQLAGSFFADAAKPLVEVLQRSNLTAEEISAVELLGGGSRIPRVKAALSEALGGRGLDMHLDADEAVVLGAALFAANLSTTFRLRKFGMTDGITYPINFQLEKTAGMPEAEGDAAFQAKPLLPFLKRLPAKRVVHLPNVTGDPLSVKLQYADPEHLPPGMTSPLLAAFEVTGIDNVTAKYNETGKISLHFRADLSGIISFSKAEAVVEIMDLVETWVPANKSANASAASNTTAVNATASASDPPSKTNGSAPAAAGAANTSADANATTGNATAANATKQKVEVPELVKVMKEKKRTVRIPLKIGGPGFTQPGLTPEQLQVSKKHLADLEAKDNARKETAMVKNELESYIIGTRDKLGSDEGVAAVTTEKLRGSFQEQLTAQEDWLYSDEGEAATAADFRKALAKLKGVGDPIMARLAEHQQRPGVVEAAEKFIDIARKSFNTWPETKPWLNATEVSALTKKVDEFDGWLQGVLKQQAKKKDHEDPAFTVDKVYERLAAVSKPFEKLQARKKPKPKPAPLSANATANSAGNASGDGANRTVGGSWEEDLAAAAKEAWDAAQKAGANASEAAAEMIKKFTKGAGNGTEAGLEKEDVADKSEL